MKLITFFKYQRPTTYICVRCGVIVTESTRKIHEDYHKEIEELKEDIARIYRGLNGYR